MKKVVLVTGGSRGIGRAVCLRFAAAGYAVGVGFHTHEEEARRTVREVQALGCEALAVRADVSARGEALGMAERVSAELGPIDALICNAGIAHSGLLQDMTEEQVDRLLRVNLYGTIYACQSVLPAMIRRQSGAIVCLSSVWGMVGASCEAVYSASKAGIIGLVKALAQEVGPSGITVNCVAPGVIDTDMNAALSIEDRQALCGQTPLGRLGQPEEIADAVFYLAHAPFVTGQVLSPNGGFVI